MDQFFHKVRVHAEIHLQPRDFFFPLLDELKGHLQPCTTENKSIVSPPPIMNTASIPKPHANCP